MNFKEYAKMNLETWKRLINCTVEHEDYGIGTIIDINIDKFKSKVILKINFNNKIVNLNNDSLGKYIFIKEDAYSYNLLREFEGLLKPRSGFVKVVTHCWSCTDAIFNNYEKCPKCNWYKCKFCNSCKCGSIYGG